MKYSVAEIFSYSPVMLCPGVRWDHGHKPRLEEPPPPSLFRKEKDHCILSSISKGLSSVDSLSGQKKGIAQLEQEIFLYELDRKLNPIMLSQTQ
jgi:hypothetical protein